LVLWHTEVEGDKPAEIAPLLGMTANSVAAMAYRAREGLRQAYLRAHLADTADDSCRWVTEHLGGFVRGGLSRRDHHKVETHLDDCRSCTAVYLELVEVNSNLRVLLAPILLGAAAAGYLTAAGHTGIGLAAPRWLRGRKVLRGHQGAAAAAVAAVAVTAIAATAVIGTRSADTDQSNGSGVSSKLTDDGPTDSTDSAEPTDRADRPDRGDHRGHAKNRRDDLDRSHHAGDPQGVEDSPSARHGNADDPGQTESTSGDPTATEPTGTGNDPTQTTPTEPTEPTSDPNTPNSTTEPTQPNQPTEPTQPTNDPSGPLADLGVGPKIHKQDFLGLLWNEVRIPASGVQKVDSATMVVTVQNLVSWSDSSGGGNVADWACSEVSTDTIQCTLDDVAQAGDPQDLGLSLTTSGTDSAVTASISANDYRDPKPGNNSVSTHVVL